MKKLFVFVLLFATAFLYAQDSSKNSQNNDKDVKINGSGILPEGWKMRLDKPEANPKDVKFVTEGSFYHFTTGPAAIYYNPKNSLKDQYTVEASFVQVKPSKHPEAYGIFFGGKNLQEDKQHYLYFLVRQDGKFLIKERDGKKTKLINNWTSNKIVKSLDKNGQVINTLSVNIGKDKVIFSVNGKEVASVSKSKLGNTNGIAGLRINHNLDVKASGFKTTEL